MNNKPSLGGKERKKSLSMKWDRPSCIDLKLVDPFHNWNRMDSSYVFLSYGFRWRTSLLMVTNHSEVTKFNMGLKEAVLSICHAIKILSNPFIASFHKWNSMNPSNMFLFHEFLWKISHLMITNSFRRYEDGVLKGGVPIPTYWVINLLFDQNFL